MGISRKSLIAIIIGMVLISSLIWEAQGTDIGAGPIRGGDPGAAPGTKPNPTPKYNRGCDEEKRCSRVPRGPHPTPRGPHPQLPRSHNKVPSGPHRKGHTGKN